METFNKLLSKTYYLLFLLIAVLVLAFISLELEFNLIILERNDKNIIEGLFTVIATLGALAIIIERTVEVLVTSARKPYRTILEENVSYYIRILNRINWQEKYNESSKEYNEKLKEAREDLIRYRAVTNRKAFIASMSLGFLLAAIAFPILRDTNVSNYLEIREQLSPPFRFSFITLDILLAGGIMSGGAELAHQLISVFSSYMEDSKKGFSTNNRYMIDSQQGTTTNNQLSRMPVNQSTNNPKINFEAAQNELNNEIKNKN
jgi:hypothetical protein